MDYEKAYKEAFERARNIRFGNPNSATANVVCEEIFPELEESEDEMIRKEMIDFLQETIDNVGYSPNIWTMNNAKRWLDWLERQGEEKSITFNTAHIINSALNDHCCKIYNALHKENGGVLSYARLQNLAIDIYEWCKKQNLAWSEDDEHRSTDAIYFLETAKSHYADTSEIEKTIVWLKSLKERIGG